MLNAFSQLIKVPLNVQWFDLYTMITYVNLIALIGTLYIGQDLILLCWMKSSHGP
jgi:hypothetical protein